jgi:cobalt/nickel transport system permease protein
MLSEPFAVGDSPLHRLDPRLRLAAAAAFSIATALCMHFSAVAAALTASLVGSRSRPPAGGGGVQAPAGGERVHPLSLGGAPAHLSRRGPPAPGAAERRTRGGRPSGADHPQIQRHRTGLHRPGRHHAACDRRPCSAPHKGAGQDRAPAAHDLPLSSSCSSRNTGGCVRAAAMRGFQPGTNLHTYRTYAYLVGMLLRKGRRTRGAGALGHALPGVPTPVSQPAGVSGRERTRRCSWADGGRRGRRDRRSGNAVRGLVTGRPPIKIGVPSKTTS